MNKTLVEILRENDISLFESGERWVAHCPFHEGDSDPSFTVYPNNTYYCWGCHVWGNPVKFLVEFKGISAKEAIEYVGEDFQNKVDRKSVIKVKNMTKTGTFLYKVSQAYHLYLKDMPGPMKYLKDRGLTQETIDKFKIGYTDGAVLNFSSVEDYQMSSEIGILNKSGSEIMSHRITVPNIIEDRYADFLMGRTVINDKIKYLGARMPKPIYGFYDFRNSPILFLVEGTFDYLLLRQWGYPTISMSGSRITASDYALLRNRLIVIIPDNDDAGLKAADEIQKKLKNTVMIEYSDLGVKDIGDLALKSDANHIFEERVRESLWELHLSSPTLEKYIPFSIDTTSSLLI